MRDSSAQQRAARAAALQRLLPRGEQRRQRRVEARLTERKRRKLANGFLGGVEMRGDDRERIFRGHGEQARKAFPQYTGRRIASADFHA